MTWMPTAGHGRKRDYAANVSFVDPGSSSPGRDRLEFAGQSRLLHRRPTRIALLPTKIDDTTWTRTSTLDGSVSFNRVPEPGVLALLGIGLLGLALRVNKKAALIFPQQVEKLRRHLRRLFFVCRGGTHRKPRQSPRIRSNQGHARQAAQI